MKLNKEQAIQNELKSQKDFINEFKGVATKKQLEQFINKSNQNIFEIRQGYNPYCIANYIIGAIDIRVSTDNQIKGKIISKLLKVL